MDTQISTNEEGRVLKQNPTNNNLSSDYMLEEFRFLKVSYEGTLTWREERFKNFINIIFGSVALLTVVAQFSNSTPALYYSIVAISSILYFYGWFVFTRLISGTLTVWKYQRAINKVRQYFVDLDTSINDYLLVSVKNPDVTSQQKKTLGKGLIGTTAFTNSLLGLVFGITLTLQILNWTAWVSVGVGIILAVSSWLIHRSYFKQQL